MKKNLIFFAFCIGLFNCVQQPTIEKDGGIMVTVSYPFYKNVAKEDLEIIKKRIVNEGLTIQQITIDSVNNTVTLYIPKTNDTTLLRTLMTQKGTISFLTSYENSEIFQNLVNANQIIRQIKEDSVAKTPITVKKKELSLTEVLKKRKLEDSVQKIIKDPLFSILLPAVTRESQPMQGSIIGYAKIKDTAMIMHYLNLSVIKALFPRNLVMGWSLKGSYTGDNILNLYAIRKDYMGFEDISKDLISCTFEPGRNNASYEIMFKLNQEGSNKFAQITRNNIGRCLPIVMDDKVLSAPRVNGIIEKGEAVITGNFSLEEARTLSGYLRSGGLSGALPITKLRLIKKK